MKPRYTRLVFIGYMPLTRKILQNFYMEFFQQNGIAVEYWDLSRLYFKNIQFASHDALPAIDRVLVLHTFLSFEREVKEARSPTTLFIPIVSFEAKVLRLFWILSRNDCSLGFFARGFLPQPPADLSSNVKKALNPARIKGFLLQKMALFSARFLRIKPYDVVFCAGQFAIDLYKNRSPIVRVNYFDFDSYRQELKTEASPLVEGRYAVFLDDHLIGDTDFKMAGVPDLDAQNYYSALSRFFALVEKKYNLKVIIAAHPKSDYRNDEFGTRQILRNQTNRLARFGEFLITHYSSSVSYAVCYGKPVLFLSSDQMRNMPYFPFIKGFSSTLGGNLYNMDHRVGEQEIIVNPPDPEKYNFYKYTFLTSPDCEQAQSPQIILDFLEGKGR